MKSDKDRNELKEQAHSSVQELILNDGTVIPLESFATTPDLNLAPSSVLATSRIKLRPTSWGATWWQYPPLYRRLQHEVVTMRLKFPQFRLVENQRMTEQFSWVGWVKPKRRQYMIEIAYPANYPEAEPKIYVHRPALPPGTPHVYSDGSLCAHISQWIPNRSTAIQMVSIAALYLHDYEEWQRTGIWPNRI